MCTNDNTTFKINNNNLKHCHKLTMTLNIRFPLSSHHPYYKEARNLKNVT